MNPPLRTPLKSRYQHNQLIGDQTPQVSLSKELKKVLNERNLLTAKSRKKVCSMLDNLTPVERNDLDKRRHFRLQAIEEILTSEKSYLKQLEILMKYFVIPLKEQAIIDDTSHTTLFGQIEMIYNLNGELLNELEKNLENVAYAFLRMAPFFKLYSVYAFDYKNALLILQELISKNPVFRKFLETTESRPEVQKKLNSLMIVPIQRVPRYRLLLEQILLYTSPADPDFKILKDSVKQVESTVSHINSVIEDQEVTQMILNLQNSLLNRTPNIVKPSRKIIKEGILSKVTRNGSQIKRYCILMSDIFMYCKLLKDRSKNTLVENSLQCCCIFPLKKCKVYDLFPGNFKITCQGDGIILCTSDYHVGQNWIASIKDAIELHIQCRKTLRKESSKRTPIRKKDVKNFDIDYVLSPNKRKCDYESVFRCKNSSDSESEDTNTSCFNIPKPKVFKRKLASTEITNKLKNQSFSEEISSPAKKICNVTFKIPQTPVGQLARVKLPWSEKKIVNSTAISSSSLNDDDVKVRNDNFDPTYGFANRFPSNKTYFRTHNIDSTIALSNNHFDIHCDSIPSTKDILYPLRESTGSTDSDSSWLHKRDFEDNKENQNNHIGSYTSLQKKRVQFEDSVFRSPSKCSGNENKPEPYKFVAPHEVQLSLGQRIMDFFTKFF